MLRLPKLLKVVRILPVAVVDQVFRLKTLVLQPHRRVPALLNYPFTGWIDGGIRMVDLTTTQVDEYENMSRIYTMPGIDLLREEIARQQGIHMRPNEVSPFDRRSVICSARGWWQPLLDHDLPYGRIPYEDTELFEFAANAPISPVLVHRIRNANKR